MFRSHLLLEWVLGPFVLKLAACKQLSGLVPAKSRAASQQPWLCGEAAALALIARASRRWSVEKCVALIASAVKDGVLCARSARRRISVS